jgi:hypothetical protein
MKQAFGRTQRGCISGINDFAMRKAGLSEEPTTGTAPKLGRERLRREMGNQHAERSLLVVSRK